MTLDSSYIARTLSWANEDLKRHTIEDTEVLDFHQSDLARKIHKSARRSRRFMKFPS